MRWSRDPTFDQNLITTAFEAFYNRPPTTAELQAYLPVFSTSPSLTYALGSIVGSDAAHRPDRQLVQHLSRPRRPPARLRRGWIKTTWAAA